jgi:hypothetical protein
MKKKFAPLSLAMLSERLAFQEEDLPSILALQEIGVLPRNLDNCRAFERGTLTYVPYPGDGLKKVYPWTREELLCPWCGVFVKDAKIVDHPHEVHVRGSEIVLQELSEWVAEMEWEGIGDDGYDPANDHRHYARAVYFGNVFEWRRVLEHARKHGLTVNSFLAAAARLVMRHSDLSLAQFAYCDPEGLNFIPQIPQDPRLDEERAKEKPREQEKQGPGEPSEGAA